MKIITKKKKGNHIFCLVDKHKIKDVIGFFNEDEFAIDIPKLRLYTKKGCTFSKTAFDLLYKNLPKE